VEVELLGFPGKIKRIDGYAVAAETGAGIEGLEAEGLGFGGVDDFVDVDPIFMQSCLSSLTRAMLTQR
jgi:hypothetical protein